ncbi:hypothetical protein P692DRAFT_20762163, partial [Suillus brevipes Sb2]
TESAGLHVRRELIETVHPVVRVPWKSVYVNPGVTRRMLGEPYSWRDTRVC